jgi:8-oxo-dGTP pyrophosphatase MutT (NUDIX family)
MKTRKQFAALPFVVIDKRVQVLLITSRDTKRWIIPKGWPKKGMASHKLAALEAYEEAGIAGRISKLPIGDYGYTKVLHNDAKAQVRVDVYGLRVDRQFLDWPERGQREMRWMKPKQAVALVREKELKELLRRFRPAGKSR